MQMTRTLLTALAALVLTAACTCKGEDYKGLFGQIRVADTRALEQTAGADETQAPNGVTFTTPAAWSSEIASTRAEAPDWVSIAPDHGDAAGTYTVRIALETNPFEEARSATITILSGDSQFEIRVTQTGTDNPIIPYSNRITGIELHHALTWDAPGSVPEEEWLATIGFQYDDAGRVVLIGMDETPENLANNIEQLFTFAYAERQIELRANDDQGSDLSYTVVLDAAGRAVEARADGGTEHWSFGYDGAGYCERIEYDGTDYTPGIESIGCGWSSGNLTALDAFDSQGGKVPEYSYAFDYQMQTTNRPEAVNLDLNALLFNVCPDFEDGEFPMGAMLSGIGRLGRRSANLTASCKDETDYGMEKLHDGTVRSYKILDERIEWTQQADGQVTQATLTRTVQQVRSKNGTKVVVENGGFTEVDIYKIRY